MLKKFLLSLIVLFVGVGAFGVYSYADTEIVADANGAAVAEENVGENGISKGVGLIAAALAIGLSAIGSGIAVAVVASSAVGAISENPSLLGKTVIFAGLAEGIAIYGLIIAIMILSKV